MRRLRSERDKILNAAKHPVPILRVLRIPAGVIVLAALFAVPYLLHIPLKTYGAAILGAAAVLSAIGTLFAALASSRAAKETQRTANIMSSQWEADQKRQQEDMVTRRAGMLRALRLECKYVAETWGNNMYARRELPRWEEWSTEVATYYPDLAVQLNEAATLLAIGNSMIDLIDKFKENDPQRGLQFQAADASMAGTAIALNDIVRHIDWITSGGFGFRMAEGKSPTSPTVRKIDLHVDRNMWSINKHLSDFPSEPTVSPTTVKVYCEMRKIVAHYNATDVEFVSTYRPLNARFETDIEIITDTRPTGHAMDIIQLDLPNPDTARGDAEHKIAEGKQ